METLFSLIGRLPADKLGHMLAGVILFAVSAPLCLFWGGGLLHALALVGLIGVLKEAYDAAYNRWVAPVHGVELNDALATLAGGALGLACALAARWVTWITVLLAPA